MGVSHTGVEVSVARPLMAHQCNNEGRARQGWREEWVAVMAVTEEVQRVLILPDSLSMQITTITGSARALVAANCHGNNKGRLPLSGEAN